MEADGAGGRPDWVPAVCTLPSAEQPVRVAEFDALFADAVWGVDRVEPRLLRMDLEPTSVVAARAADLMMRETGCCSFFGFTLTATGATLRLDVTVPPERIGVLDALAARCVATGERGTADA